MSTITNATNAIGTQAAQQASQAKGTSALGKDEFMKLMISQLKNQDPLNPMDGTQFSAQLAQFSSLEQLSNMNDSLNKSIDANYLLAQSVNNTMAATLIGKEIKLGGSSLSFNGENSITLGYKLPSDAKDVTISITDANGNVVKTISDSNILNGTHKLSWDFTDNNGKKLPFGNYSYKLKATDYSGSDLTVESYKMGVISSVKYTEQGTKLVIGNSEYSLADVLEIFGNS